MFRKITIKNYKSLADTSTELGQFTVLVGDNGAGKSSFLQAIELASWAVKYESINEALAAHQLEFRDLVYLRSSQTSILFETELEVQTPGTKGDKEKVNVLIQLAKKRYVYVDYELVTPVGKDDLSDAPYWIGSRKRWRAAKEEPGGRLTHDNVALGHSMLRDIYLSRGASERFPILYQVASHFMAYVHYEIWGPENLRTPSRSPNRRHAARATLNGLGKRGEDLAASLWTIRVKSESWQELLAELQQVYSSIREIRFRRGLAGELGIEFVEQPAASHQPLRYRPSQMSDGFMRVLALLAIKYDPTPLALLGHEEPENGLHPSALDHCTRLLKDIARNGTQVIVTTHSPYLLNQLLEDDAEPRAELRLVLRGKDGKTTIAKPDPEKVDRARRQGFGVGELWGMLLNEKDLAQS